MRMDLKFLLAALFALTGVPAPEPVVVSLPDITVTVGETTSGRVEISTPDAQPDAVARVCVDGAGIASIARHAAGHGRAPSTPAR